MDPSSKEMGDSASQMNSRIEYYTSQIERQDINDHEKANFLAERGLAYAIKREFDNGLKDFSRAIELAPESEGAIEWKLNKAKLFEYIMDYDNAIKTYIDLNNSSDNKFKSELARVYNIKAKKAIASKNYAEADKYMQEADNANPEMTDYFKWSKVKSQNEDLIGCEKLLDIYLSKHPQNLVALTIRGNVKLELKKYDEAKMDFKEILRLNPLEYSAELILKRLDAPKLNLPTDKFSREERINKYLDGIKGLDKDSQGKIKFDYMETHHTPSMNKAPDVDSSRSGSRSRRNSIGSLENY